MIASQSSAMWGTIRPGRFHLAEQLPGRGRGIKGEFEQRSVPHCTPRRDRSGPEFLASHAPHKTQSGVVALHDCHTQRRVSPGRKVGRHRPYGCGSGPGSLVRLVDYHQADPRHPVGRRFIDEVHQADPRAGFFVDNNQQVPRLIEQRRFAVLPDGGRVVAPRWRAGIVSERKEFGVAGKHDADVFEVLRDDLTQLEPLRLQS